ncbi:hypothetical protein ACGFY0_01065 [Streptomyces chartreusis]|uniref:hypothetical protein n=1 Tax=Streptomyces chartreusis TaxID=1969 RepID=UPI0037211241
MRVILTPARFIRGMMADMFASLLPGVREIRTPVLTGYMYLLALLLAFGDRIPGRKEAPDALMWFYDLGGWVGKGAAIGASAFAAYIVGSVLEVPAGTVARLLGGGYLMSVGRRRFPGFSSPLLTSGSAVILGNFVSDRIHPGQAGTPVTQVKPVQFQPIQDGITMVLRELSELRTRLYAANKDLYGEYDRLAAEGDLKVNTTVAGTVLVCTAAVRLDPRWALLCVPLLCLLPRGLWAVREANDVLVHVIVTDVVKSPRFEAYADRLEHQGPAVPHPDER